MILSWIGALCFCSALFAESNVDRTVTALDTLSSAAFGNWKAAPILDGEWAIQGNPADASFDASAWKSVPAGDPIALRACWLRKVVVLPAKFLGEPVHGPLKLHFVINRPGDIWVNGASQGHFLDTADVDLTANAQPGAKFVIAVKVAAKGYDISGRETFPLKFKTADFVLESAAPFRQEIRDLSLCLRVGQRLLSLDTTQSNARVSEVTGIDRSKFSKSERLRLDALLEKLAAEVDTAALASGDIAKYKASVASVHNQIGPLHEFAKRFTLYLDSNAHIDAAWLWRDKETVQVVKNTFSSVLNIMNHRSDFVYTQSAAAYYDWMQRDYPDLFKAILPRVKEGRWEVVGGLWVEPDCNLPGGESWGRHLLYGKRYFQQNLGVDVKIAWNPDSFGYNWNIPMLCKHAGIDAFITQKINWNGTNVFPYRIFWWESPDGSRLLTYFPFSYDSLVDDPYQLVDWLRQFEANSGLPRMALMFGVGDHGGGPSMEMLKNLDHYASLDIYPSVEHGTTGNYLAWIRQQNLAALPVWKDELFLEYHEGTLTTQAKMKAFNRTSEVLLTNAEKFSTLATAYGHKYDSARLEQAWRKVMFNQFHDILPGSGIRQIYIDATERYKAAQEAGRFELNGSLHQIARKADTQVSGSGKPVVIFNGLSWPRSGIVHVDLPEGSTGAFAIFDAAGKEIPSQIEKRDELKRTLFFIAPEIPALGYKTFEIRKQAPQTAASGLASSPDSIENSVFSVKIDPATGWVKSIYDKRYHKEVLSGPGNQLQLLEDNPGIWDAWNLGFTGVAYPCKLKSIELVESGPVRTTIRVVHTYLKPGVKKEFPTPDFPTSFFTQYISLYAGLDRVDFKTDADWWEDHTMLKVAFPLTVSDHAATYEIPFGTIRRSTGGGDKLERAKVEVAAEHFADLSQDDYGVALLNKTKYGYDIRGSVMRLSLLRSPIFPDPTADRGKHSIDYALYPHAGRVLATDTVQRGYDYNNPLIAVLTDAHQGSLGPAHSFVRLEPSSLVLATVKKAEDSNAWILQWYNSKPTDTVAKLTLPGTPSKVVESDFIEADGKPVPVNGSEITVPTKKNSLVILKVYFPDGQ